MKKTILLAAGILFLGVSATFAQVDSTAAPTPAPQSPATTQPAPSGNYTKDMVKIQQTELPDNLRQTLQDAQYKGWESGTIYRTQNSDGYLIETKDGSRTKVQRFDAMGKPIKDN